MVPPSGQALLIDTGYAGNSGRDAIRIAAAAKAAGVKKIDTLLITHFHADHVGGVPNLLERLPVATFLDHGPSVEDGGKYPSSMRKPSPVARTESIAPGEKIAIKGLDITVLTAAGHHLERKGEPNPYCAGLAPVEGETGENPQSAGVLIQFGKFRFVDPGDIIWNEELALECPDNKVGKVDVYLTAHHATHVSPKSVYGLAPRVIVMDNGPRKGGHSRRLEGAARHARTRRHLATALLRNRRQRAQPRRPLYREPRRARRRDVFEGVRLRRRLLHAVQPPQQIHENVSGQVGQRYQTNSTSPLTT